LEQIEPACRSSAAELTSGAKGTRPTAGNQGRVSALRKPLPCWSLFTEGHITFDGRLSACCFDHDGRFNMGDLNQVSFMEAWHSEPFRRLRRANLTENVAGNVCEKCLAYDESESKPQPVTLMRRSEGAPRRYSINSRAAGRCRTAPSSRRRRAGR